MVLVLRLDYRTAEQLARHLRDHLAHGSLLVPLGQTKLDVQQFQPLTLRFALPGGECSVEAEVLQLISPLGLAVRVLGDLAALRSLAGDSEPSASAEPPRVSVVDGDPEPAEEPAAAPDASGAMSVEAAEEMLADDEGGAPRSVSTLGPHNWPVERLSVEWHTLSLADKARVAKYGKRGARGVVLRMQDRTLHQFLLSNSQITAEEVAAMAGMANLDPALLKRIGTSSDWLRHSTIVRNLVCNPKSTLPQITKWIELLGEDELRRLTRTGKVRASVKQLITRRLEQRAGRR
jgi:hypothetical protein